MKKTLLLSVVTSTILLASNHGGHDNHEGHDHSAHGFEPTVALTSDFSYVNRSKELHETYIPGFTHAHGHDDHGHDHSEPHEKEGFNFNSAELEIEAPIDEHLELRSTFHLGEDSFEVEELYGTTHNRDGMNYKIGKFLSSFGVNNAKHSETWDFANQPLINNALFGSHGLNEKGVAVSWNNKHLTVGLEVLSGENEMSFGNSEIEYDANDDEVAEIEVEGSDAPEVNVAYIKYNNKIGSTVINSGLSYATGTTRYDHTEDETPHALEADTKLLGLDVAFKFPFTRTSNLTWSTEYIKREMSSGTRYAGNGTTKTVSMDQAGLYSSLVYRVNSEWKAGLRLDKITKNDKIVGGKNMTSKFDDLKRSSFMVEKNISENNKLRVQYNKDESKYHDGALVSYNDVIVQWTFAFATGEHSH